MYKVAVFIERNDLREAVLAGLAEAGCTLLLPKRQEDWLEFVCSRQPQFILVDPDSPWVEPGELISTLARHDGFSELKVILAVDESSARSIEPHWDLSDVIFPPISAAEMTTRMDLAMRRTGQPAAEDTRAAGNITIDLANYGGTRTVDVHIRRLREKLGLLPASHIETVRNVGYRFRP